MQTGITTRVDVMVSKLHELLEAKKTADPDGLGEVAILEGNPPLDQVNDGIILAASDVDTPGIVVSYGRSPSLGNRDVEAAEIAVICRSYSGDADIAARRARAAELFSVVMTVLRENQVVPSVWDRIELGLQAAWHPVYTPKGTNVFVGFTVVAMAAI